MRSEVVRLVIEQAALERIADTTYHQQARETRFHHANAAMYDNTTAEHEHHQSAGHQQGSMLRSGVVRLVIKLAALERIADTVYHSPALVARLPHAHAATKHRATMGHTRELPVGPPHRRMLASVTVA